MAHTIRPLLVCKFPLDKGMMTYRLNYGQPIQIHVYIWYIETPQGRVLVDTGTSAETCAHHGFAGGQTIQSVEQALSRLKVTPQDIDIVIITHLHWDHATFISSFPRARFYLQKTELDFAMKPHQAVASAYDRSLFKDMDFQVIDGDRQIIEGVSVLYTPGHSPGNQSVAVDTASGLAIITGFCCISENFNPPPAARAKGLEVITPGLHVDVLKAYDSALRVKKAAALVLPAHDPRFAAIGCIP